MRKFALLIGGAAALLVSAPAQAFGLRTHLYIAEQVLAGVSRDCRLNLAGTNAEVPQDVCKAIQDHPDYFMAGALGPDVFPDLIVGQNFVHPGTPNGRQAADWLEMLLVEASSDEEIAFAYGEMIHASGDVFAHTYVNNYAGDVFELSARWHKDVERRHFDLEKYIDQRLPYEPDLDALAVPSDLLVRTMVQTSYIPGNQDLTHQDILELIKGPTAKVSKVLAEKLTRAGPAAHMTAMWAILLVAERAPRTATCNEVDAVERMTVAFRNYVAAEKAARDGSTHIPSQYASAPPRIDCAKEELVAAQAAFDAAVDEGRSIGWHDQAHNEREAWWKTLKRGERKMLRRAYKEYLTAVEFREQARMVNAIAPIWAADVRKAIAAYMDASLEAGKLMVRSGEPVPPAAHERRSMTFPYEKWKSCYLPVFKGHPIDAAKLTCDRITSLNADTSLEDAAFYAGIGDTPRSLIFGYMQFSRWLDGLGLDLLLTAAKITAPDLGDLIESVHSPARVTRTKLNDTFQTPKSGQLGFRCVADFIDADLGMIARSDGTRIDEDCRPRSSDKTPAFFDPEEFVPIQHAITLGKLALLSREEVKNLAEKMAGLGSQVEVGDQTARYSIILDTVKSLDGSHQWQGASLPMPRSRSGAARVRGGAGYPRLVEPGAITIRNDNAITDRPGFPYYRTDDLRREVFSRLFPSPFEGEILKRVEFEADHYPFRPCSNDPFRPNHVEPQREEVCEVD